MQVFTLLLQTVGEDVLSALNTSSPNDIPLKEPKTYIISLVALLFINVVVMVGNFIFDLIKQRKDNHNYKVHLIANKGIEVESSIFKHFQEMASLQPGDEHKLLDLIMLLDSELNLNRLYIEKKFLNHSIEFLDYFKKILHRMTLKDVRKEESFFEKLSKAFYGQ